MGGSKDAIHLDESVLRDWYEDDGIVADASERASGLLKEEVDETGKVDASGGARVGVGSGGDRGA